MFYVAIDLVDDNPWQPRQTLDPERLRELRDSIVQLRERRPQTFGLLQVPGGRLVAVDGSAGMYEIEASTVETEDISAYLRENGLRVQLAFGHRRAAAIRGLAVDWPDRWGVLPVELGVFGDQEMAIAAWTENKDREDIRPMEEARAIQKMIEDFRWTQQQAAEKLGLNRATVANKLRLMRLPAEAQQALDAGTLSERAAIALIPLSELEPAAYSAVQGLGWADPRQLIERAPGMTSDRIRDEVERIIAYASRPLEGVRFYAKPFALEGVRAATCAACPVKITRGNKHRCQVTVCFALKSTQHRDDQVAGLRAAFPQLPIVDVHRDLTYNQREEFHDAEARMSLQQIATSEQPCQNLHAWYKPGHNGVAPADWPEFQMVCVHAAGAGCACLKKARRAAQQRDPAYRSEQQLKKQVGEQVTTPAIATLRRAAAEEPSILLRALLARADYHYRLPDTAGWDRDRLYDVVAAWLVKGATRWQEANPTQALRAANELLEGLGLERLRGSVDDTAGTIAEQVEQAHRIADYDHMRNAYAWLVESDAGTMPAEDRERLSLVHDGLVARRVQELIERRAFELAEQWIELVTTEDAGMDLMEALELASARRADGTIELGVDGDPLRGQFDRAIESQQWELAEQLLGGLEGDDPRLRTWRVALAQHRSDQAQLVAFLDGEEKEVTV